MSMIEQHSVRPAVAEEIVPDILPFEKLPIFPGGGVIQCDQMWSDRLRGAGRTFVVSVRPAGE